MVYLNTLNENNIYKKSKQLKVVKKVVKRVESAPENYYHKLWTIQGVYFSVKGNYNKSVNLLTKAFKESEKLGFNLNTVIAKKVLV